MAASAPATTTASAPAGTTTTTTTTDTTTTPASPTGPNPVDEIAKAKAAAIAAIQKAVTDAGDHFKAGLADAAVTMADDAREKLADGFQSMAAIAFDEFKEWVRREIDLSQQGLGPAARAEQNP